MDEAQLLDQLKLDNNNKLRYCPVLPDKLYCFLREGHKIGKAEPLFKRIKEDEIKVLKQTFAGVKEAVPEKDAKKDKKKEKKAKAPAQTPAPPATPVTPVEESNKKE